MRTACRNANLLALLSDNEGDQALVSQMFSRMKAHEREGMRGFRLGEALNPFNLSSATQATPSVRLDGLYLQGGVVKELQDLEFELLCGLLHLRPDFDVRPQVSRSAAFLKAIPYRQNVYSSWEPSRFKDSAVLVDDCGTETAGVIQAIFLHRYSQVSGDLKTEACVTVETYEAIDGDDPFRRYGHAGGFCCKPSPKSLHLFTLDSVLCHVGVTEFEGEPNFIHMLPLNRVGHNCLLSIICR